MVVAKAFLHNEISHEVITMLPRHDRPRLSAQQHWGGCSDCGAATTLAVRWQYRGAVLECSAS